MSAQTVIREGVSVERHVDLGGENSELGGFSHEWRITLTLSSSHDFPVVARVCDRLPANLGPPNVALPPDGDEAWSLDANTVSYRTTIPPDESVTATYLLHTDGVDRETLVSATTIEALRPVDPATDGAGIDGFGWPESPDGDGASVPNVGRAGEVEHPEAPTTRRKIERDGDFLRSGDGASISRFETSERAAAASDFLVPRQSDVDPLVSIVMPTMNEEAGIRECIDRAKAALTRLGFTGEVIVSDSSDDRTPDIAAEQGAHVVTPDQKGYGYAYRYAFERARGRYVVIGDADTTYDFEELPKLFERLQQTGADMVMGSRLEGEIKPGAMPALHQYVGNPLLTKFLNVFYDAGVSDAHSGFRVIRRDALERLDLQSDGMEFASEMIMQAAEHGLRIEEVPITYHQREGEATLDSLPDGWRHVRFMLLNAPGYLFTGPALGLGLIGVVMMALSLTGRPFAGVFFGTHTMIAGSLVVVLAYQLGSLGVFSAVAAEPIRSPRDPITKLILNRFRLEHGATLGVGLFTVGTVYTTYLVTRWAQSGYTEPPVIPVNLLAFTAIVLGVQTVFYSFFLSLLGEAGTDGSSTEEFT